MPQRSPDPVAKVTISLPRSLYERAKDRMAQFGGRMGFSNYVQFLISMDLHDLPAELHYYFRAHDGRSTRATRAILPSEPLLRVAEGDTRYRAKKKAAK